MDGRRAVRIPVRDLGCAGSGAAAIEREFAATDGVLNAYVNPATEIAYVDYDPTRTDIWALVKAIEKAGCRAGRPFEA